jgi:DNA (cytosine-5)-methyltransferase 1
MDFSWQAPARACGQPASSAGRSGAKRRRKNETLEKTPAGETIVVGSVCSGLLTEAWALESIGVPCRHAFAAEADAKLRAFISQNHEVHIVFEDVQSDKFHSQAPPVDLFVAGFPCQPFSDAGKHLGAADKRGEIILDIICYLTRCLPSAFLLENVIGLVTRHGKTFEQILLLLRDIRRGDKQRAYKIYWKVMNSAAYGAVPQNRKRVYIVGILASQRRASFCWPRQVPCPPLTEILDVVRATPLSEPTSPLARTKLRRAYAKAKAAGIDPRKQCIAVNCDARECTWKLNSTPCLTSTRGAGSGFWISTRGGRMTTAELCRLQGMAPIQNFAGLSARQLGHAVGNAFTQTVIARILAKLLPAAGLTGPLRELRAG